jgi:hypothetical protein
MLQDERDGHLGSIMEEQSEQAHSEAESDGKPHAVAV